MCVMEEKLQDVTVDEKKEEKNKNKHVAQTPVGLGLKKKMT